MNSRGIENLLGLGVGDVLSLLIGKVWMFWG